MKPKYSFFKNFKYAREGFYSAVKKEKSLRLELVAFIVLTLTALFLSVPIVWKAVLIASLLVPIIAELLNSAIEMVVDMITSQYDESAKFAKDVAASAVMLSITFSALVWIGVLVYFW